MDSAQLQRILVALDECCELTHTSFTSISTNIDEWLDNIMDCCEAVNGKLDPIIEILEDWAAEYTATYEDFLCEEYDATDIDFEITFTDYECTEELRTTTTTTVEAGYIEFQVVFTDYTCTLDFDASVTDTTTIPLKSGDLEDWSATYSDFLCELEDDPLQTSTTTTTYSTTTATTVDPTDEEWSGTYSDYLCEQVDNPLFTSSTTTREPIDEDDIVFEVTFIDYTCAETAATTTTSTSYTTTSTTYTTTTTTGIEACGVEISGQGGAGDSTHTYHIDLGTGTGVVGLYIDALDAPDKFVVEWNGSTVIDTGYQGDTEFQSILYAAQSAAGQPAEVIASPAQSVFTFEKTASARYATVTVYAPLEETLWSFTLNCPSEATTTTTNNDEAWSGTYEDYLCEQTATAGSTTTTTTLPATTTTTTQVPLAVTTITCGETASGITDYPKIIYLVTLGAGEGYVTLTYDTEAIPDKYVVEIDGAEVINTGYRGDVALQSVLDDALAAIGEPQENIVGAATGTATFYKSSSTTSAVCKIYAPIPETEWSFSLACPDDYTTTSTTQLPTTTTTTEIPPTTTTTTTNAAPVSVPNVVANTRPTCDSPVSLIPSMFTFTDSDSDDLEIVRVNSYTGAGTLTYNGIAVSDGDLMFTIGGASGSFENALVYTPDATQTAPYAFNIDFSVRTANNAEFG